jgi:hypothetical protein
MDIDMRYIILLLFANTAFGDNPHTSVIIEKSVIEQTIKKEVSRGAALGIATGQHQFSAATDAYQWSIGAGRYDGSDALSVGIGKRFDNLLINGSIGQEDGKTGAGIGVSGKF